ncbi:hypothetical protein ACG83_11060 [Frankia sp. R43]|uniref:hypothetical protein n=1 Tax=Frankia sp. R43 TaxID=269536 RepID=UPI0006CA1E3C|nr:hypothetical protein [Frankia sp. R43]KPM55803.1 hypothetical protein ACG83_11060 [Frankia sp. R43]
MSGSEVMTPTIRFKPGTSQAGATGYDVPKSTLDPRYAACSDHHVACDCREAEHAETVAELIAELQEYRRVFEALWLAAPHQVLRQAQIAWTVAQNGSYPLAPRWARQAREGGHDARQVGLLRMVHDKNLSLQDVRELAHTLLGFEPGEEGTPRLNVSEEMAAEPPF